MKIEKTDTAVAAFVFGSTRLVRILPGAPRILPDVFRSFSQTPQENAGVKYS